MSPVTFFRKWIQPLGWVVLVGAVLVTCLLLSAVNRLPELSTATAATTQLEWPTPEAPAPDWSQFRTADVEARSGDRMTLQERFKLAGTFFEFTAMGSRSRQAILDDRVEKRQYIVRERQKIDDIEIARILRDHVVLRDPDGREVELWLSLSGGPAAAQRAFVSTEREKQAAEDPQAAKAAAFGAKKTGEHSWLIKRERLIEYYTGLWDEAERMVMLFDSLKPVYTQEGWIEGYVLGVEGEGDFFDAMGLSEGDIVRSVNGVKMTNRRRAEYFVEQVVKNEASAIVLAVERGGSTNKFTYHVRD